MTASAEGSDVLIVGAGAVGSLMAARFAAAGKSVTVLEAGPGWTRGDLVSSQIWSRRLRWGGPFVATGGANPIGFGFNAGWGLGGAGLHHYGTWPRLHVEDFEVKSRYGRGLDWPLGYDDLRPFYDALQDEVGVSGDRAAETWRTDPTPYPMPPLTLTRQAEALAKGFKALDLGLAPAPLAINSIERNGRPGCLYDGWCDAGCPTGALANPLALHQPLALKHGAHFEVSTPVTRIAADRPDRVSGVFYRRADGSEAFRPARLVVLAASVVHNPAILLRSVTSDHPSGLGNRADLVGRYVMSHYGAPVFGLMPGDTDPHLGVSGAQLICHAAYRKDGHEAPAFGSYQWLVAPAMKPNDVAGLAASRFELYGPALDAFVRQATRRLANMLGMAEQLPDRDNRVVVGERGPALVNRFSESEQALWHRMRDQGLAVMKAAGAVESWAGGPMTAHLMGGTIMGADPEHSVTDSFGRVHGQRNLFVAGPGLFPTSAAVNPTFTGLALAERSAREILARWSHYG